jgi:hypothetical protein
MREMDQSLGEMREIFNGARRRILLYAQACLSASQFEAFRKLVLDEMGRSGMEGKVLDMIRRLQEKGRREIESAAKGREDAS